MNMALIAAALLAAPALIFLAECLLGLRPLRPQCLSAGADAPRFAVLIPAHDEGEGIAVTVAGIWSQLRPQDLLLVVADNCADDTAEQARSAGAWVVERDQPTHRGKGHALAFGRDALAAEPPPVVIIIDADCQVTPGSLVRLAAEASAGNAAVQAAYSMEPQADFNPLVAISSFAFRVRNLVRQRGLMRLGAAPLLQGTGMAFPWPIFAAAPLASDDIVEDLNLGIALLRQGHRLIWTEAASVTSLPASQEATIAQRTRWEHGFIASAFGNVPRLLGGALKQRRLDMALLALDLIVPPLALLVSITGLAWSAAFVLGFIDGGFGPLAILSAALAAITLGVLVAWDAEGSRLLPLGALLRVPLYILWKLPIYARLLGHRETSWIRTSRK